MSIKKSSGPVSVKTEKSPNQGSSAGASSAVLNNKQIEANPISLTHEPTWYKSAAIVIVPEYCVLTLNVHTKSSEVAFTGFTTDTMQVLVAASGGVSPLEPQTQICFPPEGDNNISLTGNKLQLKIQGDVPPGTSENFNKMALIPLYKSAASLFIPPRCLVKLELGSSASQVSIHSFTEDPEKVRLALQIGKIHTLLPNSKIFIKDTRIFGSSQNAGKV